MAWPDVNDTEQVLCQFDMDQRYGPCIGLDRESRWLRAKSLGMDPPEEVLVRIREKNSCSASLFDRRLQTRN